MRWTARGVCVVQFVVQRRACVAHTHLGKVHGDEQIGALQTRHELKFATHGLEASKTVGICTGLR